MSTVGRNDPCPCGSGRKYKRCCADADAARASTLRRLGSDAPPSHVATAGRWIAPAPGSRRTLQIDRAALAASRHDTVWEIDVVPVPITLGDSPVARPAVLLVAAAGLMVAMDVLTAPPSEPPEIAALLAETIRDVASAGGSPTAVLVRHAPIARALPAALAAVEARDVAVRLQSPLHALDRAVPSLLGALGSGAGPHAVEPDEALPMPRVSAPESWLAWGLPEPMLQALLAAAARFHVARPWTHLYNTELLTLDVPLEHADAVERWTACVMGNGGEQFGLVLYADPTDFDRMTSAALPGEAFGGMHDAVLTLDLAPRHELPRGTQREFARHGWPVAGPDAYPRLWAMNTPAGGVTRAQARALTLALDAVARFTTEHATLLATHPAPEPPLDWLDAPTGVRVTYAGDALGALDDEDASLGPWGPPIVLLPGRAEGARVDPLAGIALGPGPSLDAVDAFLARERVVIGRYEEWLTSGGHGRRALGAATARKHAMTAELFLDLLNGTHGAALVAVHEFDLRAFLYDFYPRKFMAKRIDALAVPNSLRRFFQFLALAEDLACPWATPILLDRESFEERWDTFPGGHWWDAQVQDWQAAFWNDSEARVFLPPPMLADGVEWGATMGPDEARLHGEARRRWLAWRDEAILDGALEAADVRAACVRRLQVWAHARHGGWGSRTPLAVIAAERGREH